MDQGSAPEAYKQAGMFMLVSGIVHLMVGGLMVLSGLFTCLGTYGLCCFCPFIGAVPMAAGAYELMVASQMQKGVWVGSARTSNLVGLVSAVMMLSMINIVLEVLAMVHLNKPEVVAFLEQGNSGQMDWS